MSDIIWHTERRRLGDLVEWAKNPRILSAHDAEHIRRSIDKFGLADPLVINADNTIIGGHQRKHILANPDALVDVRVPSRQLTEAEAEELSIRLNKAQGSWNWEMLANNWEMDTLVDWGFGRKELEGLDFDTQEQATVDDLEQVSGELPGLSSLKVFPKFPSSNFWDIPDLREDMLADLPAVLDVWAGPDVCQDDGFTWWLYNWRTDSVKNPPFDRTILAFYTNDERFENFWIQPDVYASKLINAGIKIAVSPNYSMWVDSPRAAHLYNIFRSRYVARYLQEAGIRIIPDINWADEKSFEFCLLGIPTNPPAVAVQFQTVKTRVERERAVNGFKLAIERLEPGAILVYGHKIAHEIVSEAGLSDGPVIYVENRSDKRRIRFSELSKESLR